MLSLPSVLLCFAQVGGAADEAKATPPVAATLRAPIVVPAPRPKAPEIPSYKVSVRMKSGRRFGGIVCRDRAFHSIVHAGGHHSAAPYQLDGRFKLRFVDGLDGEIAMRWCDVQKLEVRDILDSAGVRAMESDYATARIVRRTNAEAAEPLTPESPAGDAVAAGSDGAAAPAVGSDGSATSAAPSGAKDEALLTPKLSLLAEFPPAVGWTPERKRQIEWRRTVVGAFPDEREARFLAVYAEWEPLFLEWTVDEQRRTARETEQSRAATPAKIRAPERKSEALAPIAAPRSDPKGGTTKNGG